MPGAKYYVILDMESKRIQYGQIEITVIPARGLEVKNARRKWKCQLNSTKFHLDGRNYHLYPHL